MLKRLLKAAARPVWKAAEPLRRRFFQALNVQVARAVDDAFREHARWRFDAVEEGLGRIERHVHVARSTAENQTADANLLLDGLVREVARLQLHVEALRDSIEDSRAENGLTVLGRTG